MTGTDDEPPEWAKRRARGMMEGSDDPPEHEGDGTEDGVIDGDDGDGDDEGVSDGDDEGVSDGDDEGVSDGDDGRVSDGDDERVPDVPVEAVEEAERLTRLARGASDPDAAERYRDRRDALVGAHEYVPRIREEDDTLVLYPDEWVEDGTVRFDRIEDTDRAVEVSLSGPGEADRYREVAAYNDAVVDAVAEVADETHVENARAYATFLSNHYVRRVDDATPEIRAEFREEFFPRNVWPTDAQRAALEGSLEIVSKFANDGKVTEE